MTDSVIMQILSLYVSGFWTWAGLTLGLALICGAVGTMLNGIVKVRRD